MNVAVTLTPVRVTVNVQTRGVPTVRITPPVQLRVRAEPRITPLTVRVGGPYVLNAGGSGGLTRLRDDPNPTLGGNLTLNGFSIIGTLTAPGLVLDSGLLEAN